MKKSILEQIIENYKLTVANKGEVDFDREISHSAIHRVGLELAGKQEFGKHSNIIGWGTKEQKYFESLGIEKARELISRAIISKVPFVILSVGIEGDILDLIIEAGDKTRTPILKTDMHLSLITSTVGLDIATYLADETSVHASLINVNGIGVMIKGKSGIGKSEAVMELVQKGHVFVSDDTVIIKRIGKNFLGYPAELTRNLLEVRGVGLIDVRAIYGIQSVRGSSQINLIVELQEFKGNEGSFDRLGNKTKMEKILGGYVPKVILPVMEGRSISSLIMVAVNSYLAQKHGHDPIEIINKRRREIDE